MFALVSTPGRQYNISCGSVTPQDAARASILFDVGKQTILGFLGNVKLLNTTN